MKCTWKNCDKEGVHPQKDKNGNDWALLCNEHNKELTESLDSGEPKKLMRAWVLASGGAEKLAKKF